MPQTSLASLLTALAALAVVLALIWGAGRLARLLGLGSRGPAGRAGRALSVEETLALDQRRRLVLVRCAEGRVLLLTGGGADVVVGWLPASQGNGIAP
ncbi:MAG TPA: flagellar biosynthetic protein FliO [Acetobacteraceae bacterium]|nr:flagellar biosynthetic protein FliO [Acetobacteraceae bacterium]